MLRFIEIKSRYRSSPNTDDKYLTLKSTKYNYFIKTGIHLCKIYLPIFIQNTPIKKGNYNACRNKQ